LILSVELILEFSFTEIYYADLSDNNQYLGEEEYRRILDKLVVSMEESDDYFHNILVCSEILDRESEDSEYFEYEKERITECLEKYLKEVEKPDSDIGTYKSIGYGLLNKNVLEKISLDLKTPKRRFSSEELESIAIAMLTEDGKEKEEGIFPIDNEKRKEVVYLINKVLPDSQGNKLFVKSKLLILAGKIGYDEFIANNIGQFLEDFEDGKYFEVDLEENLLRVLVDGGVKYDIFSWEIARNIFEKLEKENSRLPKSSRSYFVNEYSGKLRAQFFVKSDFVRDMLLSFCYRNGATDFDLTARRIINESDDFSEYARRLLEDKSIPSDVKYSLFMKTLIKQLQNAEINGFKENIQLLEESFKTVKETESSLVLLYGVKTFIVDLCEFVNKEIIFSKKRNATTLRGNKDLSKYLIATVERSINKFGELLSNEKILNEMDLYESSQFFASVYPKLISFDNRRVNEVVKTYLERYLDKEIEVIRKEPIQFYSKIGGKDGIVDYFEIMNELFIGLGILTLCMEAKDQMFERDSEGRVKHTEYGFLSPNKKGVLSIREFKSDEINRVANKYFKFLSDISWQVWTMDDVQEVIKMGGVAREIDKKGWSDDMISFWAVKHYSPECKEKGEILYKLLIKHMMFPWEFKKASIHLASIPNIELRELFGETEIKYYFSQLIVDYFKERMVSNNL